MDENLLSAREKNIFITLVKASDYVPIGQLANSFSVSKKTICRDIESIKAKIGFANIIQHERGKGYNIKRLADGENLVDEKSKSAEFWGMNIEDRRRNILVLLLLQTPEETSIAKLSEIYYISNASIVNDLNSIEKELDQYHLLLIRSRSGTHIKGEERNIRNLLLQKLSPFLFRWGQLLWQASTEKVDIAEKHDLYTFFSRKDVGFVKLLLDKVEAILCGKIKDPYYINVFTHILILLKRLENSNPLEKSNQYSGFQCENKLVVDCTTMVVREISKYLDSAVPKDEFFYIYQYLYSSRIDESIDSIKADVDKTDNFEEVFVAELIQRVSQEIHMDFLEDTNLKNALLLHIRPLKKRIESKIFISNPIKEEIKRDFPQVFKTVKKVLAEQSLISIFKELTEDEISYIAVYFQASIERDIQQKRVVIVCSSGVGTSHLLAARVKRAFPEWKIVDTVSASHSYKFTPKDVDIILTTIKLENQTIPSVFVSAIFNEVDVIKVKQALKITC
jgi:activator of the mannose operon (transcriptional antiterminator)